MSNSQLPLTPSPPEAKCLQSWGCWEGTTATISSVIPIGSASVGLSPTSSSGALTLGKSWKSRRENMIHPNWVRPDAVHPKDKISLVSTPKKDGAQALSTFFLWQVKVESARMPCRKQLEIRTSKVSCQHQLPMRCRGKLILFLRQATGTLLYSQIRNSQM